MNDASDATDEIMQLVADLAVAQLALNGRVDKFELKKTIVRRVHGIELGDDLAPNALTKKQHHALDKVIDLSLFRMQFNNYVSENPDVTSQPIRPLRFLLQLVKYKLLLWKRRRED